MLLQRIFIALVLSSTCLADDWWDGSGGYESTGGFKTEMNEGRDVGTPDTTAQQNLNSFMGAVGHQANGLPQINPDTGTYETPAEQIIRQSKIPANLAPEARKEVLGTNGDPTSGGRLGLDEKLVDARRLSDTGLAAEKVQMTTTALGTISLVGMMLTDPAGAAEEMKKLDKQLDAYGKNAAVFEESRDGFDQSARRLTRDYEALQNNASAFTASGTPASSSTTSDTNPSGGDAAKKQAADDILAGMSQAQLDTFRERGVSANDFAQKFANGEFKNSADLKEFFNTADGAGADSKSFAEAREAGSGSAAERGFASGRDEEGAVLSVKSGVTVSTGAHHDDSQNGLVAQLASFFKGDTAKNGRADLTITNEEGSDVSEKEKRALLTFALQWWKKGDAADKGEGNALWDASEGLKIGKKGSTIFDIAHRTYGKYRAERGSTKGPVAFNR